MDDRLVEISPTCGTKGELIGEVETVAPAHLHNVLLGPSAKAYMAWKQGEANVTNIGISATVQDYSPQEIDTGVFSKCGENL